MRQGSALLFAAGMFCIAGLTAGAEEPAIGGYLRHQLGATVNDVEVVRNTVTAEMMLSYRGTDVDLYVNPTFEVTAEARAEVGLREAYLDVYTDSVDLRIGRQIIIWGKADGLAITDIVSPKDLTSFLIPDFRELRVGVVAAKADAYVGPVTLELIYIPVFTPSILPASGSIWSVPFVAPIVPDINPASGAGTAMLDGELYARARLQASLLDFDIAGGYYWTNEPTPTITKTFASPGVLSAIEITPEYYRQWLAGASLNSALGPLVVRTEAGFFTPKRLITTDMTDTDGYVEKEYLQSLLGIDTSVVGFDLSAQIMHQFIFDYEDALQQDEHTFTATLRARRSFLRDRLVIDALSYVGLSEPDALVKVGATFAPADALSFRAEANLFFGETGQFGRYADNDLAVFTTKYSY